MINFPDSHTISKTAMTTTVLPSPRSLLSPYREQNTFRSHDILKYCLRDAIFLANPDLQERLFIDPANEEDDDEPFSEREETMGKTVLRMMKRVYAMRPKERLSVDVSDVNSVREICPRLFEHLRRIDPERPSLKIRRVLYGRLAMPYQSYVLESLIFAGKFLARCMEKFEGKEGAIFKRASEELEHFYAAENVLYWIDCAGETMDPFGKPGKYRKSKIEDQDMCSFSFEDGS